MNLSCSASVFVFDPQSGVPILEGKSRPRWSVTARDLCPFGAVGQNFMEEVRVLMTPVSLPCCHIGDLECFGGGGE